MIRKQYPSQETVRRLLNYDKDMGVFTWKERPLSDFEDDMNPSMSHITWNANYKGKVSGSSGENYVRIQMGKENYAAHKLAWIYVYGDEYQGDLDHKNRNKRDNRIDNLRPVTFAQNTQNSRLYNTNTSGIRGISWNKKNKRWVACITQNGKYIYLGMHNNFNDAVNARYDAEKEYGFIEYNPESTAHKYLQGLNV